MIVGGAGGGGTVFEHGDPVGKTSLAQVTVGLQLGGQAYSEIIFFENAAALSDFKKGNFALAAEVSAVALSAGASANAKYQTGVAVFAGCAEGNGRNTCRVLSARGGACAPLRVDAGNSAHSGVCRGGTSHAPQGLGIGSAWPVLCALCSTTATR